MGILVYVRGLIVLPGIGTLLLAVRSVCAAVSEYEVSSRFDLVMSRCMDFLEEGLSLSGWNTHWGDFNTLNHHGFSATHERMVTRRMSIYRSGNPRAMSCIAFTPDCGFLI